jgi:hypothetical protein
VHNPKLFPTFRSTKHERLALNCREPFAVCTHVEEIEDERSPVAESFRHLIHERKPCKKA